MQGLGSILDRSSHASLFSIITAESLHRSLGHDYLKAMQSTIMDCCRSADSSSMIALAGVSCICIAIAIAIG